MRKAFASGDREGEEELNHASERLFSLGSALRADFTAVNLTAGSVMPNGKSERATIFQIAPLLCRMFAAYFFRGI